MEKDAPKVEPEKILGLDDGQPRELLGKSRRNRPDHSGAAKLLTQLVRTRRRTT